MPRLADVNILVALSVEAHPLHERVLAWWKALPVGEVLYIPRHSQMAFLRVLSTEAAMREQALSLPEAWECLARMMASGRFAIAEEPANIEEKWRTFCLSFGRSPKVVADAYLAAFAVCGGFTLATLDKAFRQFRGLDAEMPA